MPRQRAKQLIKTPGGEPMPISVSRYTFRIEQLEKRVADLEELLRARQTSEEIELRDIPQEQAREEILAALASGQGLDQLEIADQLLLDLGLVNEICNELVSQGEVQYL